MAAAAILDFKNFKFLTVGAVSRVELHHRAKFRQNRSNRGRNMAIFRFFKKAAAAILDFRNFNFFDGGGGQESRTTSPRQISLKSCQPQARYRDFSILKDGRRCQLGFWKF